jgi:hypothetical protein
MLPAIIWAGLNILVISSYMRVARIENDGHIFIVHHFLFDGLVHSPVPAVMPLFQFKVFLQLIFI